MTTTKDANGKDVVNVHANLMAHAVVGAVTAYAAGNSAVAGAVLGAVSSYASGNSALAGAQAGKNAVENNLFGKVLVEGCAISAPCRTKVAEQLLEIGVKAGLTGTVAKTLADKLTADELDHLVTLQMTSNDEITSKYLGLLQDNYLPETSSNPNLGKDLDNDQKAELGDVGSGTPGGWGPEDEENVRNNEGNNPSQKGSNFTNSEIDDRIASANKPINNQGMSAAARAWEKHAGRPG